MARICSGPVRQQPPIQSAPALRHVSANAPKLCGSEVPAQLRVSATQSSPELGYTAIRFALTARILLNERQDMTRRSAVDADGDDLAARIEQARAFFNRLAVAGVTVVAACEADIGRQIGEALE